MPDLSLPGMSRTLRSLRTRTRTSSVDARHRSEALALLDREPLASPAVCYRIHPARMAGGGVIDLGGVSLHAPALAAEPGELIAVGAAACTLGPALPERISALFAARRRSLALALDGIGSEMLFRLADRAAAVIRRVAGRDGLATGMEISPGDPDLALDQQSVVLALAGSCRGAVAVTEAGMLTPIHSLSLIVLLGRNLRQRSAARCDACPSRDRCAVS